MRKASLTDFFLDVIDDAVRAYGVPPNWPVRIFYVLPNEAMESVILKHFRMSRKDFEEAFESLSRDFMELWTSAYQKFTWDPENDVVYNNEGMKFETSKIKSGHDHRDYLTINGFISTPELSQQLLTFYVQRENSKNPIGRLPFHNDLQRTVFESLKGRELIAKCNVSAEIKKQCNKDNYQFYKNRLLSEFGLDFNNDSYGYPDARKMYMQMYEVFGWSDSDLNDVISYRGDVMSSQEFADGRIWLPPYRPDKRGNWMPIKDFFVVINVKDHEASLSCLIDRANLTKSRLIYDGHDPLLETKVRHRIPIWLSRINGEFGGSEIDHIVDPKSRVRDVLARIYYVK